MITLASPLGELRLYAHADELCGVYLPDQAAPSAPHRASPVLGAAAAQLVEYFVGRRRTFDLPLAPRGTGFQEIVWRALTLIPYGETRSYGELARAIGRPAASRAVGAANGKNPISIIVPCHRVIASSGQLTGYAGGLAAKRWLLEHEARSFAPRSVEHVTTS
jgi:methylated-DNA-[protein]-cysteine S-methyltransferase